MLLISTLAEHTKNIASDPRVSLMFDGTAETSDRLSGARVTVVARANPSDVASDRERFLGRHPGAAMYADFPDFGFYRVEPERAHLVDGFGKIEWIDAGNLLLPGDHAALQSSERDIVAHMNADHADAIELYATKLLGHPAGGWQMTGCDPEGCDLALNGKVARLEFPTTITDAQSARRALVALVDEARQV